MISEETVTRALAGVRDPEIGEPLGDAGMVDAVEVSDGTVSVRILLPTPDHSQKDALKQRIGEALEQVPDVERVRIQFGVMTDEQRTGLADHLQTENPFQGEGATATVIGVSSGKGGVGKSTVTVNLAAALQSEGHNVGVLDADIWGFSIPRMFGLRGQKPNAYGGMIMPLTKNGVKVISIGFFLETEEDPVVWRGPMLHKALEQFLTDVYWGKDLDYLLIDLPPGTGDIAISLASFVPDMGIAVVTTPQPVAQKVAERAANMTSKVKLKVLGVIENMSGVVCEHCGETTPLFGEGGGRELADTLGVPLLGEIPLLPAIREYSDAGEPFVWEFPDHPVTEAYRTAAGALAKHRPRRRLKVV